MARVLWRAFVLAVLGIVAGAVVSLLAGRLVSDLLFQVQPWDVSTFAVVTILLLLVSLGCAVAPAVRAAGMDPMRILREQ